MIFSPTFHLTAPPRSHVINSNANASRRLIEQKICVLWSTAREEHIGSYSRKYVYRKSKSDSALLSMRNDIPGDSCASDIPAKPANTRIEMLLCSTAERLNKFRFRKSLRLRLLLYNFLPVSLFVFQRRGRCSFDAHTTKRRITHGSTNTRGLLRYAREVRAGRWQWITCFSGGWRVRRASVHKEGRLNKIKSNRPPRTKRYL